MRNYRASFAVALLVSLAVGGCFGHRLERAGQSENAVGIVMMQIMGSVMMTAGVVSDNDGVGAGGLAIILMGEYSDWLQARKTRERPLLPPPIRRHPATTNYYDY